MITMIEEGVDDDTVNKDKEDTDIGGEDEDDGDDGSDGDGNDDDCGGSGGSNGSGIKGDVMITMRNKKVSMMALITSTKSKRTLTLVMKMKMMVMMVVMIVVVMMTMNSDDKCSSGDCNGSGIKQSHGGEGRCINDDTGDREE